MNQYLFYILGLYQHHVFFVLPPGPDEEEEEQRIGGYSGDVDRHVLNEVQIAENIVKIQGCRGHDPRTGEGGQVIADALCPLCISQDADL